MSPGRDTFVYDPMNPVPSRGGNTCCLGDILPPGSFDQRPVEARNDVLVYTTEPLEQDLEVKWYFYSHKEILDVHEWPANVKIFDGKSRSSLYGTFTVMDFQDDQEYVYGDLSGTLYLTTLGMRVGF